MEGLIGSAGRENYLEWLLAAVRNGADNHQNILAARAEVRRELHGEGEGGVVYGGLGEEREAVGGVRPVEEPSLWWGEGDVLAGGGDTGVEGGGDPGLVPATDRDLLLVVPPILGPEVTVEAAGVGRLAQVVSPPVPLPAP